MNLSDQEFTFQSRLKLMSIIFLAPLFLEGCKKEMLTKVPQHSPQDYNLNKIQPASNSGFDAENKLKSFQKILKRIEKSGLQGKSLIYCKKMIEMIKAKVPADRLIHEARSYLHELKIDNNLKYQDLDFAYLSVMMITVLNEGDEPKTIIFDQYKIFKENLFDNYPPLKNLYEKGLCHGFIQMVNLFEEQNEGSGRAILNVIRGAADFLASKNRMRSADGDKILGNFEKMIEVINELHHYQAHEGFDEIIPTRDVDLASATEIIEPKDLLSLIDKDNAENNGNTFIVGLYPFDKPVSSAGHDISIITRNGKYTIFDPNTGYFNNLNRTDAELTLKMIQTFCLRIIGVELKPESIMYYKELRSGERFYKAEYVENYQRMQLAIKQIAKELDNNLIQTLEKKLEYEEPWYDIPTEINAVSQEEHSESFNYERQIILQLQGDNTSYESAKRLFFKHPDKSEWVQAKNISKLESNVLENGQIIKKGYILSKLNNEGRIRIVIVGHGKVTKDLKFFKNNETLFGGNTSEEMMGILNSVFYHMHSQPRSKIKGIRLDLVGCQLEPVDLNVHKEETFAGKLAFWLREKAALLNIPNNDLSVVVRNYDISILNDGRKASRQQRDQKVKRNKKALTKLEYYWENSELKIKTSIMPETAETNSDIGILKENVHNDHIHSDKKKLFIAEYEKSNINKDQLIEKELIVQTKKILKIKNEFDKFINETIQNLSPEEKQLNWKVVTDKETGAGILINENNEKKFINTENSRFKAYVETNNAIVRTADPKIHNENFIHNHSRMGGAALNAYAIFAMITSDNSHASQFMKYTAATNLGLSVAVDATDLYLYASTVSNYLPELSALKTFSKVGGGVSLGLGSALSLISIISDSIQLGKATNDLQKLQAELALGGDVMGAMGLVVPILISLAGAEAAAGPVGLAIGAGTIAYAEISNLVVEGKEDYEKFNFIANRFQDIMDAQKNPFIAQNGFIQINNSALVNEVNLETGDIEFGIISAKNENGININKALIPDNKKIDPNLLKNNKLFIAPFNLNETFETNWVTRTVNLLGEYNLYPTDAFKKIIHDMHIWQKNGEVEPILLPNTFATTNQNVLLGKFDYTATEKKITFAKDPRIVTIPKLAKYKEKDKLSYFFTGNGSVNTIMLSDIVIPIHIKTVPNDQWIFNIDNLIVDAPRLGETQMVLSEFKSTLGEINAKADSILGEYQERIKTDGLMGRIWHTSDGGFFDPLFPNQRKKKNKLDQFKNLYYAENENINKFLQLNIIGDVNEYKKQLDNISSWINKFTDLGNYDEILVTSYFNEKVNKAKDYFYLIMNGYNIDGEYDQYEYYLNNIEFNKQNSTLNIADQTIKFEGEFNGAIELTLGKLNNDLMAKPTLILLYDKEKNKFIKKVIFDETKNISENMKTLKWAKEKYTNLDLSDVISTGLNSIIDIKNEISISLYDDMDKDHNSSNSKSVYIKRKNFKKSIYLGNFNKPNDISIHRISDKYFAIKNSFDQTLLKFQIVKNDIKIISISEWVDAEKFYQNIENKGKSLKDNFLTRNSLSEKNLDKNVSIEIYNNDRSLIYTSKDIILLNKFSYSEFEYSYVKNQLVFRIGLDASSEMNDILQEIIDEYNPELIIVPDITKSQFNVSFLFEYKNKFAVYGPYLKTLKVPNNDPFIFRKINKEAVLGISNYNRILALINFDLNTNIANISENKVLDSIIISESVL